MTGMADSRDAGTCLLSHGQRVLVIGAGPSGLVAAKYLLESEFGLKVVVYEQGSTIGGTFSNKTYDDTTLVSSKYITLFADLRCPASTPEHMTSVSYVEYLQRYCDEFSLWPSPESASGAASGMRHAQTRPGCSGGRTQKQHYAAGARTRRPQTTPCSHRRRRRKFGDNRVLIDR